MAGVGAGLTGAVLAGNPVPGVAGQTGTASLVGPWLVSVPQPDGTTFVAVQSFLPDGGTLTQFRSANGTFGASLGCGVWTQTGERSFATTFAAAEYNFQTGATTGAATVQANVTVDEAGDTWSGMGRISFLRTDGTLLDQTPVF